MIRVAFDYRTGERREIEVIAYRDPNDHSIIRVLNATEPAPEGLEAFDSGAINSTTSDTRRPNPIRPFKLHPQNPHRRVFFCLNPAMCRAWRL